MDVHKQQVPGQSKEQYLMSYAIEPSQPRQRLTCCVRCSFKACTAAKRATSGWPGGFPAGGAIEEAAAPGAAGGGVTCVAREGAARALHHCMPYAEERARHVMRTAWQANTGPGRAYLSGRTTIGIKGTGLGLGRGRSYGSARGALPLL